MKTKEITKRTKKPISRHEHVITEDGVWFVPAADIHETEQGLFIQVDMPGCYDKNITLDLQGEELLLTGHVSYEEEKDEDILYTEYDVGHYHRHFLLSRDFDYNKVDASMNEGVLTIKVPRTESMIPKRLT